MLTVRLHLQSHEERLFCDGKLLTFSFTGVFDITNCDFKISHSPFVNWNMKSSTRPSCHRYLNKLFGK